MFKSKPESYFVRKDIKSYFSNRSRSSLIAELANTEKALNDSSSEEIKKLYGMRYRRIAEALIEKIERLNNEQA